jgi:hypothetical protein
MTSVADVTATEAKRPRHAGAARATAIVVQKELRILRRDWVGICLLILAPIVVITVAGFSLGKVYGGDAGVHLLPVVDEDRGEAAKAITDALAVIPEVDLRTIESRAEAQRMVRDQGVAAVALIIPAGTTTMLIGGGIPQLILYTDPVKHLEIVNFKLLISEVLRRVSSIAVDRARNDGIVAEAKASEAAGRWCTGVGRVKSLTYKSPARGIAPAGALREATRQTAVAFRGADRGRNR